MVVFVLRLVFYAILLIGIYYTPYYKMFMVGGLSYCFILLEIRGYALEACIETIHKLAARIRTQ